MLRKRLPAFTLLELLVASVLFVAVSVIVTGIASSILRVQLAHKQSQGITSQSQQVLDQISNDLNLSLRLTDSSGMLIPGRVAARDGVILYQFKDSVINSPVQNIPHDFMIVMVVPQLNSKGAIPTSPTYVKHVYCAEVQKSGSTVVGKRMVRYTIAPDTTFNSTTFDLAVDKSRYCSPDAMTKLFKTPASVAIAKPTPEYLTDGTFQAINLRFWPLWAATVQGNEFYDIDPPGVRIELTSKYNIANTPGGLAGESRVSDLASNPAQIVNKVSVFRDGQHITHLQ